MDQIPNQPTQDTGSFLKTAGVVLVVNYRYRFVSSLNMLIDVQLSLLDVDLFHS